MSIAGHSKVKAVQRKFKSGLEVTKPCFSRQTLAAKQKLSASNRRKSA